MRSIPLRTAGRPDGQRGGTPGRRLAVTLAAAVCIAAGCAAGRSPQAGQDGAPRVLLLGEAHDNPDGHRQRLELLQAELDAGWRPAIAMEQFDRERQADLDRAAASCPDADCVIRLAASGGPQWQWTHYRPVIELALRYRLPLLAANVSRADASRIVRAGFAASLDAQTIAEYGLDRPLPPALLEGQRREIVQGHCGKLPESLVDGMVRAQIARDVWMAKVVSAHAGRGAVLLAGNGHVRKDLGVAHWLTGPAARHAQAVGFVEDASGAPYDIVRPIARVGRPDPCEALGSRPG